MEQQSKFALLGQIELFSGLDEHELQLLFDHSALRNYPKNTVVIQEGDESDSLYVIVEGRVKVFLMDERGKEVILNFQEQGEYFGELALVDQNNRSASVITMEPCTFLVISRADFMRCLSMHPDIAIRVMRGLSRRLRTLTDNVRSLALLDVYGRVARTLLQLAENKDGKLVVNSTLTRKDLSNLVGSSREMVTRILKDLATGGYITLQGKRIIINEKLPPGW